MIIKRINIQIVTTLGILLCTTESVIATNFFEQRHRGWLWFEQKEESKKQQELNITPEVARAQVERFKQELEDLRYVMIASPTVENVKAYKEKEKLMMEQGMQLGNSWTMVNFMYPEYFDHNKEPTNVHAVKMKRDVDNEDNAIKIKEFARKYDLVFFFKGGCKYCHALEPVLKEFAEKYAFSVEAVSFDGSSSQNFKTVNSQDLPKSLLSKLDIKSVPLVIAVNKEGRSAFELIRGYVAISELEEYSLMAIKYLKENGKW